MLTLSKNIKRMLVRIEQTIEKDIENGIVYPYTIYPSDVAKSKIVHVGEDTTRIQKKNFNRFKKSLEDGTNMFMKCDDIDKEKSMIGIVRDINRFLEPFEDEKKSQIENETLISQKLVKRLESFLKEERNSSNEAVALRLFLKNSRSLSWGLIDESCSEKKFLLVDSEKDYKDILKKECVKELTDLKSKIHIVFSKIPESEIIQEKGLQWDFKRFARENEYDEERTDAYKKWYGIRTKGIYYVYIPDSIF